VAPRFTNQNIIGWLEIFSSLPRHRSLKEIFVSPGWLLYDGNNYFVMSTDGAAAPRIIYCLCERRDCRNLRDRNPLRVVGAGTLLRALGANAFPITFHKLRINYDFIRRDKRVTSNWAINEKSLVYARIFIRLDSITLAHACTFALSREEEDFFAK